MPFLIVVLFLDCVLCMKLLLNEFCLAGDVKTELNFFCLGKVLGFLFDT